jgi:hypothetical protein
MESSSFRASGIGNLRGLAFHDAVALAAHREGRVEHDGVAGHHAVEEMPQRREMLVARSDAGGFREFRKILPHVPGRDLRQLAPAVFLSPLQEISFTACR